MNSLSELTQPFIDSMMLRFDLWRIERRRAAIVKEQEVLEKMINNDLKAISLLVTEDINLQHQLSFLPKGIDL